MSLTEMLDGLLTTVRVSLLQSFPGITKSSLIRMAAMARCVAVLLLSNQRKRRRREQQLHAAAPRIEARRRDHVFRFADEQSATRGLVGNGSIGHVELASVRRVIERRG